MEPNPYEAPQYPTEMRSQEHDWIWSAVVFVTVGVPFALSAIFVIWFIASIVQLALYGSPGIKGLS